MEDTETKGQGNIEVIHLRMAGCNRSPVAAEVLSSGFVFSF